MEQRGAAAIAPGQASRGFLFRKFLIRGVPEHATFHLRGMESLSVASLLLTGVFEPLRLSHTTMIVLPSSIETERLYVFDFTLRRVVSCNQT